MIFIFFHEVDPNNMTSLTPHKSEHCVVVMALMLFENVVLSELYSEWVTFYSIRTASVILRLQNSGIKVVGKIHGLCSEGSLWQQCQNNVDELTKCLNECCSRQQYLSLAWLKVFYRVCFYLHGLPDGWSLLVQYNSSSTRSISGSEKFTEFAEAARSLMFILHVKCFFRERSPPPHIWPSHVQNSILYVRLRWSHSV